MRFKLIFGILIFFLFGLFLSVKVNAQAPVSNYLNTNTNVPQNFHTYTQSVFIEVGSAIACQMTGVDPANPHQGCLGTDPKTGKIGFVENGGGLIGLTGNLIASTFNIPISSTEYFGSLAGNFGIAKKTYAQQDSGTGFRGLKPIMAVWQAFRNIVYLFFVLIFIVIGLAIMFRIKIDPRTVMTIQNQIPKIIIALVLVTLSYAIVGILIDFMYVFIYLIFNIFYPNILNDITNFNPNVIQGSNPVSAVGFLGGLNMAWNASWGLGGIIVSLFDNTPGKVVAGLVGGLIGNKIGSGISAFGFNLGGVGAAIGGFGGFFGANKIYQFLGSIIALIVIGAAILSALFRLWFQLIKAYIFILINTVFAPFWIVAGLFPGSTLGFGPWLRDMIGNLAAFPATLVMFLLGRVFINQFGNSGGNSQNFIPPFIGNPGKQDAFGAIIGVGIILLTPQVVTVVRQAIKAPQGKLSSGIGQSLGTGASLAGAPPAAIWNRLMRRPGPGVAQGPLRAQIVAQAGRFGSIGRAVAGMFS